MKIKVKPEDFLVDELTDLPIGKSGEWAVYCLEKKCWNTLDAIRWLCRELKVSSHHIAYGGKKDRYGITRQYITIRSPHPHQITHDNITLNYLGRSSEPMGPKRITGNRFQVVVRRLTPEVALQAIREAELVRIFGFPNYFDDQRFGSFDRLQGFWAEKVLKRQFNGAVKILLTSIHPEDKSSEKQRKRYFFDHWRMWEECREMAVTPFEKKAFDHLLRQPFDFLSVLFQLPREEASLMIAAYQSYLWNSVLAAVIENSDFNASFSTKGKAGSYIFFRRIPKKDWLFWHELHIPTIAAQMEPLSPRIGDIYRNIMEKDGLIHPMFNQIKYRKAFFSSFLRKGTVIPGELNVSSSADEIYEGYEKLCLSFELPRGCYATMLLKRLLEIPPALKS